MSIKKITVMAASLTLGAGIAANAGGYTPPVVEPIIAPIEEPVLDWAGGYAGATLGYGFGGKDRIGISDSTDTLLGDIGELEMDGANAGIRAGYRWQRDKWVFGPELGWEITDIKGDTSGMIGGTEYGAESKVKNVLALRFKTGYAVRPDMLVYGIAGWARADVDYDIAGEDVGYDTDGYILGLGVEKKINERTSITGEYEYANFGKETLEFGEYSTKATVDYNNLKVGVNFSF
ncbi:outer membrane beta-barrel protein [Paracoccus sp. MBLB3053]|uniref:Outer membrane beta-barrel protein n=1 Tax=Paracoccus aurantius TaxID=3073814 RepID=A0ABU2HPV2_9RHOB|nr:outer membrane beta-barrel protein [Paracoccus sp. MBLB3053]MDS9467076.1 outer membrane beta-barrel protein [Paracoccus sp. MBLB3053]